MSYRGSWKIDDYLTFCCNTHDPDTGVATDADSAPAFRCYEDETGTPILTGSMALLDAANTTGFYSERIQLTAANGFEKGKCYTIYITATVDSDTGTMHHNFQIEAEVDANTVSATNVSANVEQISGDATAADDLELLVENCKGTDHKVLLSTDAQDLSASMDVNTKLIEAADPTDTIRDAVVDDATRIDASALNTLSGHDPGGTLCADGTPLTAAETESEVNDALVALHLDHLLAADYDPASKPGTATALLNELIESDGGVSRLTQNALEQGPNTTTGLTLHSDYDAAKTAAPASEYDTEMARITANVALASVCTETRLAELDAANLPTDIAALPTTAEMNAEIDTALADIHLDHLLATTYDPAAKPGAADALLNELIESDAGVSRYTANSLEEAPTGGSAPTVSEIRTEIDDNSTQLAAIVADTNELQTDDIPGAISGLNDPTAAAIRTEMDSNSTQLANIVADTNELQIDDVPGLIAALNDIAVTDVTQRQIPDSVPADGTLPTIEQALYMITQFLHERAVSGTTVTVKKVDGSTSLLTLTLDDGTDPTSITRSG